MAKTAQAVIETKVKDGASAGFRKVDKAMKNTAKQGKVLNQQFRFMRGGLGQVGHQVQDVAVQLQMGQNAMLVFGQQGSQIASLFGPGGAMFGAVIAIGAALSMSLAPAFFGATEAAKELKDATKGLIDNFDDLGPAQQRFARILATKKLKEYEAELKKLNETTREQMTTVLTGSFGIVYGRKDLETLEEYNERITKLDSDTEFYEAAIAALKEKVDNTTTAFQKQDAALLKQIETYGMSSLAVREYEIRQQVLRDELSATEGLQLLMHLAELKRLEEITKAREKAAKAGKPETENQFMARITPELDDEAFAIQMDSIKKKAEDMGLTEAIGKIFTEYKNMDASLQASMMNTASTITSQFATTFDTMSGFFKKGSKEAKAFALISKTLAAANALIQGHVSAGLTMTAYAGMAAAAATNPVTAVTAPAILAAGKAHAATMKVMGSINAGMILGTALAEASFEGGGFTGRGSRSGGVDGKGGFPAILHPNETVIDHTKGGSVGGVVVNQVINISTGVQDTVRSEIKNLMPQIAEASKVAVAQETRRGGSYSQMIQGR